MGVMLAEDNSMKLIFWEGLARMFNVYFASSERKAIEYFSIDSIVNPELVTISATENRIIADSYASENDGKSVENYKISICLLYTSPSPRDLSTSRMPSSA